MLDFDRVDFVVATFPTGRTCARLGEMFVGLHCTLYFPHISTWRCRRSKKRFRNELEVEEEEHPEADCIDHLEEETLLPQTIESQNLTDLPLFYQHSPRWYHNRLSCRHIPDLKCIEMRPACSAAGKNRWTHVMCTLLSTKTLLFLPDVQLMPVSLSSRRGPISTAVPSRRRLFKMNNFSKECSLLEHFFRTI